jgi:ABC-2 type transport system permease protein
MSNQLLFQPRRAKVWLAKAASVVVGTTVCAAVVVAGFWAAMLLLAQSRGLSTSSATVSDIVGSSARGLGLVAGVALGSFALTMLLRHTVGTLGLLFAYAVVGEGLAASLPFDRMSQWSMAQNVMAWLQNGVDIFDDSICSTASGCNPRYTLTLDHAVVYLGVLLLLAVIASVASFRARDVP